MNTLAMENPMTVGVEDHLARQAYEQQAVQAAHQFVENPSFDPTTTQQEMGGFQANQPESMPDLGASMGVFYLAAIAAFRNNPNISQEELMSTVMGAALATEQGQSVANRISEAQAAAHWHQGYTRDQEARYWASKEEDEKDKS